MSGNSAIPTVRGSAQKHLLRYPVEADISSWAAENIRFPAGAEAFRSFDPALSPWAAGPFEWFADQITERIYLVQGSQTSKTVTEMVCARWAAEFRPGRALWISSTEDEASEFFTDRLQPMILESGDRPTEKHDWRKSAFKLGAMEIRVAWASSAAKLRAWPCRYIFGDEVALWGMLPRIGHALPYAWQRTRAFRGKRKGIFGTTPREAADLSWQMATAAAFYQWWVPCPHCGEFQFLHWSRVKFDHCRNADGVWDVPRVRRETYYVCQHCACEVDESDRSRMIAQGRLQRVDPNGYAPLEDDPDARDKTLQVPAIYSPFVTMGELAVAWIKATAGGPDSLRIFVTDELAEPWEERGEAPSYEILEGRQVKGNAQGVVPAEARYLTAGIDVQKNLLYWSVWAWGQGLTGWLVDFGVSDRVTWEEVFTAVTKEYPIVGGGTMRVRAGRGEAMIDTGYDVDEVVAHCDEWNWRLKEPVFQPAKGDKPHAVMVRLGQAYDRDARTGKPLKKRMQLRLVCSDSLKRAVHRRLQITGETGGLWLPENIDEMFLQQLVGEELVDLPDGRTEWREVGENHFLDTSVYALAAAFIYRELVTVPQAPKPAPKKPPPIGEPDRPRRGIRRNYR